MDPTKDPAAGPPPDFTSTVVEIWTLYAVGSLMIAARLFVRVKLVGFDRLHPDDFLVCLAWLAYTAVMVMGHLFLVVAQGRHTGTLTPEWRASMPPSEYPAWEFGSKIFVAGVLCYAAVLWLLKINMLFFYRRLVVGLWVERLIMPAFLFVGTTAVGVVLVYTTSCIPFRGFWQVHPDPGATCVPMSKVLLYTILVLNLMSDLCIIGIPIPIIAPLRASKARKLGLYFLLSLGVFCMVCAIVHIVLLFSLKRESDGVRWFIRENFVSIMVGQVPIAFPLFKKQFWQGVYGLDKNATDDGPLRKLSTDGSHSHQLSSLSNNRKPKDPFSLTQLVISRVDSSESQREMIQGSQRDISKATTAERASPEPSQAHGLGVVARSYSMKSHHEKGTATPPYTPGAVTVTQTFEVTDGTRHRSECDKHWKKPWEKPSSESTDVHPL